MSRFLALNKWAVFVVFVILDVLCVGMGMGVPIFCIGLGFLVGWYIAARAALSTSDLSEVLTTVLIQAVAASAITLALMAIIWGSVTPMLFDPAADLANFGIPMILYDPRVSFIGWLVLMVFISPFLQLLTSLFSSHLTLLVWLRRRPRTA
jgi:hypothetical protein